MNKTDDATVINIKDQMTLTTWEYNLFVEFETREEKARGIAINKMLILYGLIAVYVYGTLQVLGTLDGFVNNILGL